MPQDDSIPEEYFCSISGQIMIEPVTTADGNTYEREAIEEWLKTNDTSPLVNEKLSHKGLTDNLYARRQILSFLDRHPKIYEEAEVYLPKLWIAQCLMAIKHNQPQEVRRWLAKDRRLLTVKLEGDATAFHLACEFSSPELVEVLLKIFKQRNQVPIPGAVGFKDIHLNVLLENALKNFDQTQCELLLRLGANLEQPEASTQNTLLHRMVLKDNQEGVNWLLDRKTILESRNREGNTPLLLAIIHNYTKLSALLLTRNANIQVKNLEQQSPVLIALLNGNHDILCRLVGDQKAALSPLHLGLALKDNEIIRVLLTKKIGAIEACDEHQRTPLYSAVESGNLEAARLLIAEGANPVLNCGTTQLNVLQIASARGDIDILKSLLQTKASEFIDVQNAKGETPLHLSVQIGRDDIVSLLLTAGASPKIKNAQGQTPLDLAKMTQNPRMANLIVETTRALKKARLEQINKLYHITLEQASKIAELKLTLEKQAEGFKIQLSTIERTLQEERSKKENLPADMLQSMEAQIKQLRSVIAEAALSNSSKSLIFRTSASPNPVTFHINPAAVSKADEKDTIEFLRLVATGEQDKAEEMLKSDPTLALVSGDVTDLSKRTFNNITGFQYAVWALDWHMWTMIRKYLPDEAAREQAQGFGTGAWMTSHGVHANLKTLMQAYQTTKDLYKASKYNEGDIAWIQQVGGAQLSLPAHVINEYFHPARPFSPLPNFRDAAPLPRRGTVAEGGWLTASYNGGKLGEMFAWCRGQYGTMPWAGGRGRGVGPHAWWRLAASAGWMVEAAADHMSIRALASARTAQREELITELRSRSLQRKVA